MRKKRPRNRNSLRSRHTVYDDWDTLPEADKRYRAQRQRKRTWEIHKLLITKNTYLCPHCKQVKPRDEMTIDHIIPICKGGRTVVDNVQIICSQCNSAKGKDDAISCREGHGT